MRTEGVSAKLVFDGAYLFIPEEMGTPRDDQMQGTMAEQLTELAGRVCYDSLGKGRPSFSTSDVQGYHDHIAETQHGSVQEHFNFTVEIPDAYASAGELALCCMNRPGVTLLPAKNSDKSRLTVNLRSVLQWSKWSSCFYDKTYPHLQQYNADLNAMLRQLGNTLAPHIVEPCWSEDNDDILDSGTCGVIVEPENDHEKWVTMYLTGSRGLSHELVRHGDFTAISQRSTRYVDESEGMWVAHPLVTDYRTRFPDLTVFSDVDDLIHNAKSLYDKLVGVLESDLLQKGTNKQTARKQARGAARGYLGNALQTELIFSASVAQWKWMLNQRASVHADAEIRQMFCDCLRELKLSRYGDCFNDWSLTSSPDGIGEIAVCQAVPRQGT